MPNTVNLGDHFERFVADQVATGRFTNVSEVVRAGLRLLEEHEEERLSKLAELKRSIAEGIASGNAGFLDLDAAYERARKAAKSVK
jgi:antitoxin ParD1/3/4